MADEDHIARVARAVCVADGQDPDEMIALGVEGSGEESEIYRRDVLVSAWTSYDADLELKKERRQGSALMVINPRGSGLATINAGATIRRDRLPASRKPAVASSAVVS